MNSIQTFLNSSRRQIVRAIAIGVVVSSTIFGLFIAAMLLGGRSFGLGILLVLMILNIVVSGSVLRIINHRPLSHAALPLAGVLTLGVVAASIFFPEIKASTAPILVLVALLISLIGHPRLTLAAAVICTLVAMAIVLIPTPASIGMSFGPLLPLIQASAAGAVVALTWLITDRLIASLTTAIRLAEQRASEAEAARVDAEAARAEIEQRNAEQQRLLELVQTLELPIIPISQGVLVTPLVGNLDSRRIDAIQRRLLEMVRQQRAHTVVLDVTGVSVIDTAVARRLLLIAQAVRLLGAQTLLSGISAHVAQTLVSLGVALDDLRTVSNLGQALEAARHN
jgi:anti-anti-sigma factor